MKLDVHVDGLHQVEEDFVKMGRRAMDAHPLMMALNRLTRASVAAQFETEGGSGHHHWAPDKPETLARKMVEGYGTRTEVMTGRLRASLMGGPGHISFVTNDMSVFGTDIPYAAYQKRDILELTPKDYIIATNMAENWLLHGALVP